MDMIHALQEAARAVGTTRAFDARQAFSRRVGKHRIFPVGLGSALQKAVREGYLSVTMDGSRRRGREYAFTERGREAFATDAQAGKRKHEHGGST